MAASPTDIAADLRDRITSGDLPPGATLPTHSEAQQQYGCSRNAVRTAYQQLQEEGLVLGVRRRGTVVLDPAARRIPRGRTVYRDDLGYYFDRAAQPFKPVSRPTVAWSTAGRDIAHRLDVEPGSDVVVRDRVLGEPGQRHGRPQPLQACTTYLPGWLATELPVIAEADTGAGGILDRIEEHFAQPLRWQEFTTAALADVDTARQLRLPRSAVLLRVIRVATLRRGRPIEVTDIRMDATRFEIPHTLRRDSSAAWPVEPAARRNTPHA